MDNNQQNILIVEDEEANREAILDLMDSYGIIAEGAENGAVALDKIRENHYSLLVTDLNMPELSGEELIRSVSQMEYPPLILVQTVVTDMTKIVELMRNGVYDYISKPYSNEEFIHRVRLALEVSELRRVKQNIEKEREARIQSQLDWNIWRDKNLRNDEDVADSNLIESIRTSLSQASGFGSLVSLVQLLKSKAKLEGEKYVVSKKLMEMVFENGDIARNITNTFEELDYILQTEMEREELEVLDLAKLIQESIERTKESANLDNHTVKFAQGKWADSRVKVSLNRNYMERVLDELLYNAYKFSESGSVVYVILELRKSHIKISFLSDPKEDGRGGKGIPESYQKLVFEPFFRISKHVFENYPTHDYGIGLTFVDKVIRKHEGDIHAFMVQSHLNPESKTEMVNIEIELPITQKV